MITNSIARRGFMLVLSSPSGAGKTTISRLLLQNDNNIVMSVSYTTRDKRNGEENGKDYYFIDNKEFGQKINLNFFYEYAQVFGNFYGTPKKFVETSLSQGQDVLFDIDWQGTHRLTQIARDDIVSIFILPPSLAELERRLRSRGKDSEEVILRRMNHASSEISHWNEYDYVIVNDSIDSSLQKVLHILQAERCKRIRQQGLQSFVNSIVK